MLAGLHRAIERHRELLSGGITDGKAHMRCAREVERDHDGITAGGNRVGIRIAEPQVGRQRTRCDTGDQRIAYLSLDHAGAGHGPAAQRIREGDTLHHARVNEGGARPCSALVGTDPGVLVAQDPNDPTGGIGMHADEAFARHRVERGDPALSAGDGALDPAGNLVHQPAPERIDEGDVGYAADAAARRFHLPGLSAVDRAKDVRVVIVVHVRRCEPAVVAVGEGQGVVQRNAGERALGLLHPRRATVAGQEDVGTVPCALADGDAFTGVPEVQVPEARVDAVELVLPAHTAVGRFPDMSASRVDETLRSPGADPRGVAVERPDAEHGDFRFGQGELRPCPSLVGGDGDARRIPREPERAVRRDEHVIDMRVHAFGLHDFPLSRDHVRGLQREGLRARPGGIRRFDRAAGEQVARGPSHDAEHGIDGHALRAFHEAERRLRPGVDHGRVDEGLEHMQGGGIRTRAEFRQLLLRDDPLEIVHTASVRDGPQRPALLLVEQALHGDGGHAAAEALPRPAFVITDERAEIRSDHERIVEFDDIVDRDVREISGDTAPVFPVIGGFPDFFYLVAAEGRVHLARGEGPERAAGGHGKLSRGHVPRASLVVRHAGLPGCGREHHLVVIRSDIHRGDVVAPATGAEEAGLQLRPALPPVGTAVHAVRAEVQHLRVLPIHGIRDIEQRPLVGQVADRPGPRAPEILRPPELEALLRGVHDIGTGGMDEAMPAVPVQHQVEIRRRVVGEQRPVVLRTSEHERRGAGVHVPADELRDGKPEVAFLQRRPFVG